MGKTTGINAGSWMDANEIIKENLGFAKNRSEAMSWAIADFMSYCYEEDLSFEHVLKLSKKAFEWQISCECVKCKKKFSPDDQREGGGYCVLCIPKEGHPKSHSK